MPLPLPFLDQRRERETPAPPMPRPGTAGRVQRPLATVATAPWTPTMNLSRAHQKAAALNGSRAENKSVKRKSKDPMSNWLFSYIRMSMHMRICIHIRLLMRDIATSINTTKLDQNFLSSLSYQEGAACYYESVVIMKRRLSSYQEEGSVR